MNLWTNPIQVAADWLMGLFAGWGLPEILASIITQLIGIVILVTIMLVASRTGWGRTVWVRLA